MRKLCCVVYLLLLMQPAFAADISAAGKTLTVLASHSDDTGLPPPLSLEDDPDSGLPLPAFSHPAPAREQRLNSKNDIPNLSVTRAFQPRAPPHTFFA